MKSSTRVRFVESNLGVQGGDEATCDRFADTDRWITRRRSPPVVLVLKERQMMRHECDRCRREIETENEVWYAVRIEALPHANVLASDDDRDHLMEVVEELDAIESVEGGLVTDYSPLEATYDLCEECYEKYRKSPLGAEPATLGFSRN